MDAETAIIVYNCFYQLLQGAFIILGTIVNTVAILAGGCLGAILKTGIPQSYNRTIMKSVALAVILIGLLSAIKTENLLLVILSLAIGSLLGEMLKIEKGLEKLGKWLEGKVAVSSGQFAQGFVSSSLLFCVGAMSIVGSLESGLSGNHQTLFAKSVLDGISSIVLASSMGIGVIFSAAAVFIYQGLITVLASFVQPLLIPAVVKEMSATGGLLIVAIGFNLLDLPKIKVGNMLPAVLVPIVYSLLLTLWDMLRALV